MILKLGRQKAFECIRKWFLQRNRIIHVTRAFSGGLPCGPFIIQQNVRTSTFEIASHLRSSSISFGFYSSKSGSLDKLKFESVCTETLDSLTEYFEELIETVSEFKNADVTYSDGVLTVHLGQSYGTYVINRQSPNLQIWLSSPTSGPKRYDFVNGSWVYKHDNTTLHSLLDKELQAIVKGRVEFSKRCAHSQCQDERR